METILFILSIASFIHEILGIRKKRFSFIFRYFIVLLLFKNIDVFNNGWLNFWLTEMISIGFIIYVISYGIVGLLMVFSDVYEKVTWQVVYFIVYIIVTLIVWLISLLLVRLGILPIF